MRKGFVYFIRGGAVIKIGFATNVLNRMRDLQIGSPHALHLLGYMPGSIYEEKRLHRLFSAHRSHGEWFRRSPELLAFISENTTLPERVTVTASRLSAHSRLRALLDDADITVAGFAVILRASPERAQGIVDGTVKPSAREAKRLDKATLGAVTTADLLMDMRGEHSLAA